MGITLTTPTATLVRDYARIHPGDTSLVQDDPKALAETLRLVHETGNVELLTPYLKPEQKPTVFRLRHLRGRASVEFGAIMAPTLSATGEATDQTITTMAHLSLAGVDNWDGEPLKWRAHRSYPFRVLTDESFDDLCSIAGGELVFWIGSEAFQARELSPKA